MLGSLNTLCDSGKELVSAEQCNKAAVSLGLIFIDIDESSSGYPGGCYQMTGGPEDQVYFNKHSGMVHSSGRPICLKGKAQSIIDRNVDIYIFLNWQKFRSFSISNI